MLIQQRDIYDCAICCIAMATGRAYEDVVTAAGEEYNPAKGVRREYKILEALGYSNTFNNGEPVGDFAAFWCGYEISPQFFRRLAWGRRALFSVPSLNLEGEHHMVFWDGRQVFDPSQKKTYERWDQLLPREIILFRQL